MSWVSWKVPMPTTSVSEGRFNNPPDQAAASSAVFMAPLRATGVLGTREDIEAEIDVVIAAMRMFGFKPPDQIMREVAAYGARLVELAILLHRVESLDRTYLRIRTMQIAPIQDELERQFKIASRLIEQQRQDLEMIK